MIRKSVLCLLISMLMSCSASRPFVDPEVSVVNLMFEGMTLFETTALFSVRIDNENPYDLDIEGAVHRFYLNDVYVGKGFDRTGFNLPRLSSKNHQIKVHISNLSLLTKMQSLISQNKLSFKIESTLYPRGAGPSKVTVFDSGSLDFQGLQKNGSRSFKRFIEAQPFSPG